MHHNRGAIIGLTLAMAVLSASAGRANAQTTETHERDGTENVRQRLSGAPFHFVGGEQQRNAIHEAINQSVAPMNFIERPIARRRLTDRNVVEPTVSFQFRPGTLNVELGRNSTVSPDNFAPAPARATTGEHMQVRQRILGDRLVQSLTTSEGERTDEFTVSPDGRRLTMHVTVRSPKLRAPMRYQLNYAR